MMTRRALFALAPAVALKQPCAIQWHQFSTIGTGVNLPSQSEALTRFGVAVDVYTDDADVEAFSVSLIYSTNGGPRTEQRKLVYRDLAGAVPGWTTCVFWTGRPVDVLAARVRELTSTNETWMGVQP